MAHLWVARFSRARLAADLDGYAVVGITLLGLLAMQPAFATGFELVDDHEILRFSPYALADPQLVHPPDLFEQISLDAGNGRFRPLYWVVRYAQILTLGQNPFAWHTTYVLLALATAVSLYFSLRGLGMSMLPSVCAGSFILVAGGVNSVWIRLGPQEGLASAALVAAIYALTRSAQARASPRWHWVVALAASAAPLFKESFSLVVPAFLALRWQVLQRGGDTRARSSRWFLLPAGVGFASLLAAFLVGSLAPNSYGGSFLMRGGIDDRDVTGQNLAILATLGGVVLPVLVLGLAIECLRHGIFARTVRAWLIGAGIVLMVLIPQLVLYRSEPGFVAGRYILPAGFGLACGVAAGLEWLRQRRFYALFIAAAVIWILILGLSAVWTWRYAENTRAHSSVLARTVGALIATAPRGATVAILADPNDAQEELAVSLPYYIVAAGRNDLDFHLVLTPLNDSHAEEVTNILAGYFSNRIGLDQRSCANVAVVVQLTQQSLDAFPCLARTELHSPLVFRVS